MKFQFSNLPVPEVGKIYPAVITNATILDEDTDKERVLINVRIDNMQAPRPASFNTANETGARMLNDLLNGLGYKEGDILAFLKDKTVNVKTKNNGEYTNTNVYAPNQKLKLQSLYSSSFSNFKVS